MKSMPSLLIKIGVFAAVMAVILVGVLRTIEKPVRGDVTGYTRCSPTPTACAWATTSANTV